MARYRSVACVGNGVVIKTSGIKGAGNGLWAGRAFAKNELVTEYVGQLIDHDKAKQLREAGLHTHVRVLNFKFLYIDGLKCIDEAGGKGGASFANDARDTQRTNTLYVTRFDSHSGRSRVFLQALRDIAAGEELFVSYGHDYWKSMAALAGDASAAAAPGLSAAVSDDMLQCSDAQASQRSTSASSSSDQSSTDLRSLRQQRRSQRLSQQTAACTGPPAPSAAAAPGAATSSQCPPLPAAAAAKVLAAHGPTTAAATQPLPRVIRAKPPPSTSANVEQLPQQAAPKQTRPSHVHIQQARGQKQQMQQVAAVQEAQDDAKLVDQQQQKHREQNQARQQRQRQPQQQHHREECAHDLPESAAVRSPMAPAAHSKQQSEQLQALQGARKQMQTPTAAVQPGSKSTEPPVRPRALRSVTRQLAFVAADKC